MCQDIQTKAKNDGWRIQEIPWMAPGKLEVIAPRSRLSQFLLFYGLLAFFGGIIATKASVAIGFGVAGTGLVCMLLTNLVMAKNTYGRFKPVEARCLDREFRHFHHTRRLPKGGIEEHHSWVARLLCEYGPPHAPVQVTPIVPNTIAFTRKEDCERYIEERIREGKCRLWVDPNNPLHTCFHDKPVFQVRGN